MTRTILTAVALAALLALAVPSKAQAYGAYHAGYTTCGAGGVQHYGSTAATGPYGGSVSHTGSTTATPYGTAHTGTTSVTGPGGRTDTVSTTGARAYSPTMYGGYSAVGVSGTGGSAGVVRTGYVHP
jgi:hypothetical protein